ncbi:MAG: hypothetical protein IRZ11_05905 [Clostridia bacterium]|nr:hypothetical protein [Clostridia bacterium]
MPFGLRLPVVLVVAAAVLAVLLGGESLYTTARIDRPLRAAVMQVPGVTAVAVDASRPTVEVQVSLGRVPNLMETYQDIARAAERTLGSRPFAIELRDRRTPALTAAYYDLDAALEEGIATGRFTEMDARVAETAQELGLAGAKVYVDAERVYLSLEAGDGYLYAVLPRAPGGGTGGR